MPKVVTAFFGRKRFNRYAQERARVADGAFFGLGFPGHHTYLSPYLGDWVGVAAVERSSPGARIAEMRVARSKGGRGR